MLRTAESPVSTFAEEEQHEGGDEAEADREGERNNGHGENSGQLMNQWVGDEVQDKISSVPLIAPAGVGVRTWKRRINPKAQASFLEGSLAGCSHGQPTVAAEFASADAKRVLWDGKAEHVGGGSPQA